MEPTLPQHLYLISHDLDRGRFDPISTSYRGHLLRAAALAELVIGGWIRDDNGRVARAADAPPPRDAFLAEVWGGLSPKSPEPWANAVPDRTWTAEGTVRDQLVENGTVTVERRRALGLLPFRKVVPVRPEDVRLLRERTREAVLSGGGPAVAPAEDVALAAIAVDGDIGTVFTPKERHRHRAAVKELHERFGAEFPGMRNAILAAVVNRRAGNA